MNIEFIEMLRRMKEIHEKKGADYTTSPDINPYENFMRANLIAGWFPHNYKSFIVLIGTKLARLASLLSNNVKPQNESLDDSFLDLATYVVLMYCYWKSQNRGFAGPKNDD